MSKQRLRSFERSLPMALLRAREAVMKKFMPALKARSVSPQQWRVIRALENEDGLALSELSSRCFLLMPSLSRIIRNLESRNLVRREAVESDQRRSMIFLTKAGRCMFEDMVPSSIERYEFIADRFEPAKMELLYELLDELVEKLDECEA